MPIVIVLAGVLGGLWYQDSHPKQVPAVSATAEVNKSSELKTDTKVSDKRSPASLGKTE